MVYKFEGWTLYCRDVRLKGGKNQRIYFFSKKKPKSGTPCDMPDGFIVKKINNTGSNMPYLRRR